MSLEVFTCEQGSPEWYQCRLGIPTASEFKTIIGIKKDAKEKVTRQTYMFKLAGEIINQEPSENYTNPYMDRGKELEPEIRNLYCMMQNCDAQQVGFLRDGRRGASPDSLIGNNGMLEIKSQAPHILLKTIFANVVPPEHMAQLQGNLWIAGREWIDFCSGFRKMKPFIKRVYRNEEYIRTIAEGVDAFLHELDEVVARYDAYA